MAYASLISLVILNLISLSATQDLNACPSGWTESTISGTCIKLFDKKKSWKDARSTCQAEAGDLVKIKNEEMNHFIWDLLSSSSPTESHWIGLHDYFEEGKFEWLDEDFEANYTHWGSRQPNNLKSYGGTNDQDCVEIGNPHLEASGWNDLQCSEVIKFICEKSIGAAPTVPDPQVVHTGDCPSEWTKSIISGTCIKLESEKKSWRDARSTCKAEGGDLVKIENEEMNQFIWDLLSSSSPTESYWIGLHDYFEEGKFEWLDEDFEANYTHWGSGQPNNLKSYRGTIDQDCVEIGNPHVKASGWNDLECSKVIKFICEKSIGAAPTVPAF